MKFTNFSFKNEAVWIVILSLGIPSTGLLVGFLFRLLR